MSVPVIIVHGGAWAVPEDLIKGSHEGIKRAARAGYHVLKNGGSAVDDVQAAICVLEDDSTFDAGCGSVLNMNGEVEMDSVIMDGRTLKTGAVACVQNIKNPIKLARAVMEKVRVNYDSIGTLCGGDVGRGANQFAEEVGIDKVPTETLVSEKARQELVTCKEYGNTIGTLFRRRLGSEHDTVGAVALDCHGNISFGTSTGGISCKKLGRVGDSPIVGSGGYADNEVGGVSCTGHGESISKVVLAHRITTLIKQGLDVQQAADDALSYMAKRVHGYGGVIVIDNHGNVAKSFTTERMTWAWVKDDVMHHGIDIGEDLTEKDHRTVQTVFQLYPAFQVRLRAMRGINGTLFASFCDPERTSGQINEKLARSVGREPVYVLINTFKQGIIEIHTPGSRFAGECPDILTLMSKILFNTRKCLGHNFLAARSNSRNCKRIYKIVSYVIVANRRFSFSIVLSG